MDKAIELYQKSLVIMTKVEGPEGTHVAIILNGIAGIKQQQVRARVWRHPLHPDAGWFSS